MGSRRLYKAIAEGFKNARPDGDADAEAWTAWRACVQSTASALAAENGGFNYMLFYRASGLEE